MDDGALGKQYGDGELICRQGEPGDRMFIMQAGHAVVSCEAGGGHVVLGELKAGDIFGEMAIFDRQPRSATVRAKGSARVLTLDKVGFLRRVHEDPSLAYRMLQTMSRRLRHLTTEVSRTHVEPGALPSHMVIVSADRPDLYARLTSDFAGHPAVQVAMDRRAGDGAPDHAALSAEQRSMDRRYQPGLDEALRKHGVAIVCSENHS